MSSICRATSNHCQIRLFCFLQHPRSSLVENTLREENNYSGLPRPGVVPQCLGLVWLDNCSGEVDMMERLASGGKGGSRRHGVKESSGIIRFDDGISLKCTQWPAKHQQRILVPSPGVLVPYACIASVHLTEDVWWILEEILHDQHLRLWIAFELWKLPTRQDDYWIDLGIGKASPQDSTANKASATG